MTKSFRTLLVKPRTSIREALQRMDRIGEKILFIVDSRKRLLGTSTDGDIRRWILQGGSLDEAISQAMNSAPIVLKEGFRREDAVSLMVTHGIEYIPVVDGGRAIVSVVDWKDISLNRTAAAGENLRKIPVVIMAGGEGSRLSPLTKILPKPLIPIVDRPILEVVIGRFTAFGCSDFYITLNYKSDLIKSYFSSIDHSYRLHYVKEAEPCGTAGSLHLLRGKLHSTFFLSNCDILVESDYREIMRFHREKSHRITLVGSLKHYTIPYGVCEISEDGALRTLVEKPEYDYLVNTGLYVLEPDVIDHIPQGVCYHMTDLIEQYLSRGERVGVYPVSEKCWFDMGQTEAFQDMVKRFGIK